MGPIYKIDTGRISVADAKLLILNALAYEESGGGKIYGTLGVDGEINWDIDTLQTESERQATERFLHNDFLELCTSLGFEPTLRYSPARTGYTGVGASEDASYMLTHEQFARLCAKYSLGVEVRVPPSGDPIGMDASSSQAHCTSPNPKKETSEERCARLLQWLEEEEKRGSRGALARVVLRDGRARQTVSADIEKAKAKRKSDSSPFARMGKVLGK